MAECSVKGFPCRNYSHTTKTEGVCLNLKWTVENFSILLIEKDYFYPSLRPTIQCDLKVCFFIYNGFAIYVSNKLKYDVYFNATTVINDLEGNQLFKEAVAKIKLTQSLTNILPGLKNRSILPADSFVIEIKLELYNLDSKKLDIDIQENELKLLEDMKNFILSEHPCEVILKTNDEEIPANKAILRARSSVFRKMFDHPTSEQEENVVRVDDVTDSTLKALVDFLYSGKADLPKSDLPALQELYYAADKYDVLGLRTACSQAILSLLKEENVVGNLLLADRHSDDYLKNECLLFIRSCIETLMDSESWINLKASDPGLVIEVLETCCKGSAALQQKSK